MQGTDRFVAHVQRVKNGVVKGLFSMTILPSELQLKPFVGWQLDIETYPDLKSWNHFNIG